MNNLTTRKIVFGLLMALVLAFSVQGTADAQTITETSGDHQNQMFDDRFAAPLVFTVSNVIAGEIAQPTVTGDGTSATATVAANSANFNR